MEEKLLNSTKDILNILEESINDGDYITNFPDDIVLKYFETIKDFEEILERFISDIWQYARYNFISEISNIDYSDEYAQYKQIFRWKDNEYCIYEMDEKYGDDHYFVFSKFYGEYEKYHYTAIDIEAMLNSKPMIDRNLQVKSAIYKRLDDLKNTLNSDYDIKNEEFKSIVKEYITENAL